MKNDLKNIMLNWLINLFFLALQMGATNPGDAAPGTIRGDFATAPDGDMIPNIVHGSDSEESAAREIKIWFGE